MKIVPASEVDENLWPAILHQRHDDWPWPFSKIYRWQTAYFGGPPSMLDGNAEELKFYYRRVDDFVWRPCWPDEPGAVEWWHPKPIPDRGQWWRGSPDFYAQTYDNGVYYRSGYRWDDIDGYYNKPSFTIKVF